MIFAQNARILHNKKYFFLSNFRGARTPPPLVFYVYEFYGNCDMGLIDWLAIAIVSADVLTSEYTKLLTGNL